MSAETPLILFAGKRFSPGIEEIDLVNAPVVTLDPLGELPELRVVRIQQTNPHESPGGTLLDLSALRKCPRLTVVEIPEQNVRSLAGMENHRDLHTLDVSFTRIADLTPLADMPALRRVVLQRLDVDELVIERLRKARPEVEVVE